jgi:Flp pilus assembly pilin Flp
MNRNHSPDSLDSDRLFQRFWAFGRFRKLRLQWVYGQCRRNRSGVAAVEFAVVATLLVVLMNGIGQGFPQQVVS